MIEVNRSIGKIKALSTDVNFQNDLQFSINPRLISRIPSNPNNFSRFDLYSNGCNVSKAVVEFLFLNDGYVPIAVVSIENNWRFIVSNSICIVNCFIL
jgi:hypothetical protein